jgi:hypothetical protein
VAGPRSASSPYRAGGGRRRAAADDGGLVGELIQQFADPLAFYRELVQNSIDAGATAVAVTVAKEGDAVRVSVRDDGRGMDREILENRLTVLFRSGKEERDDAIGKFGIGFVSVLAVAPDLVEVRSATGDGVRWTLQLHPDRTYELFRAPGSGRGTTVLLHLPAGTDFEALAEGSETALRTWCEHTEIPIRLLVQVAGEAEARRQVRVDRPFGVASVLSVDVERGGTRVAIGLPEAEQPPQIAFYNRGLLLHRASDRHFGGLRIKVLDARLEHTLSRDNVREDEHHRRALQVVRHVLAVDFARALLEALREAAETWTPTDGARYVDLVRAFARADLELSRPDFPLPLVHRDGGQGHATVRAVRRRGAFGVGGGGSSVSAALAASGTPVLPLEIFGQARVLEELLEDPPLDVETAYTLASPVEATGPDLVLLEEVDRLLDRAHRPNRALRFVEVEGLGAGALFVSGTTAGPPALLRAEEAATDPFRLLFRPPLWLNAGHPTVRAARTLAATAPRRAGALLARAILRAAPVQLDGDLDDAWLVTSLERALGTER